MSALLQLWQTSTVAEYKRAFENCMYHLLAVDATLSSKWFVSHFVNGLRNEFRAAVRLQNPASVTRAAALAHIQEEENEHQHPWARPAAHARHHTTSGTNVAAQGTSVVARTDGGRNNLDDYARER